jgi:RNA polymerase sigma factor (sigma-70 family)
MYFRAHKQAVSLNEDIELQDLEDHDVLDNYEELINVLDPEQKKIIQLLYEGYTYKEIGDALHKPENTIKTIIRRLRLAVANTGDAQT